MSANYLHAKVCFAKYLATDLMDLMDLHEYYWNTNCRNL